LSMSRLPKYSSYRTLAPLIQSFALAGGNLSQPIELTSDELVLAARLGRKQIRAEGQGTHPRTNRRKMELGRGEAEAAAIAINRGWTFLTEDQAAVELLRHLYPDVPVQGTCALLVHAAEQGIVACSEAADLFNRRIVDQLCFWAFRTSSGKQERLWLRCDPPRCSWERTLR
jgi:predicted nucleic acid-binding protein